MNSTAPASRPLPKREILDIAPYVPGTSGLGTGQKFYKLSSNETPLGPPKGALDAFAQAAGRLEIYPDGTALMLRQAIGDVYGLSSDHILCGNGSDELLALLAHCYLGAGDEGIMTEHGFDIYDIQMRAAGAGVIKAKEKDCRIDVDTIIKALSPKTKAVFIANPNNPTGTYLNAHELRRLHAALPRHVLLVLDGAYGEYVTKADYEVGIELVSSYENVVMTRTFSKIYGLAGLRIGWLYAPSPIIDALNRVRAPFNVSAPAQAAACAAIRDRDFVQKSVAFNTEWRNWLETELTALGLHVTPSVANFLLLHFPDSPLKTAALADEYLKKNGFILRRVIGYGFPNALRMSIGLEEANRGVVAALKNFLK